MINLQSSVRLINQVSKQFRNLVRLESEKQGLNGSYWPVLMYLAPKDGLTQLDLASLMQLAPPTTSLKLQKMETEGLIERRSDPSDQRQVRVYLTQNGRALYEKMKIIVQKIEKLALETVTKEEEAQIERILMKIKDNLHQ